MPVELFSALNNSIALAKRLREISNNIKDAEFNQLLADLYNELADIKMEMAGMKEQVAELKEENLRLKTMQPENNVKPKLDRGCYIFEGEEGLFCTGCYDSERKKIQTTRLRGRVRACPVCKNVFQG
ncbi:hypothetical protein [Gimesia sp.]|uniref:hypothetical protein n=1 Tax=Gimesia sp. TaxID=2024833 RepID=UPI003A93178D